MRNTNRCLISERWCRGVAISRHGPRRAPHVIMHKIGNEPWKVAGPYIEESGRSKNSVTDMHDPVRGDEKEMQRSKKSKHIAGMFRCKLSCLAVGSLPQKQSHASMRDLALPNRSTCNDSSPCNHGHVLYCNKIQTGPAHPPRRLPLHVQTGFTARNYMFIYPMDRGR